jgi:FKBP-type peptidyl-prolyl cis-trans isomerase
VPKLPLPEFKPVDESKLKTTKSGLKYQVLKEGTGAAPLAGKQVTTHYAGWLTDGTLFDSSYPRGEPFSFRVGSGVIEGWSEGVQLMKEGAVFLFVLPPNLAYGPRAVGGQIPANATLVFQIELLKVN